MTRRGTTASISVSSLVGAAVEILQQYGLGDLSMRQVAARLGVQPSALYWHVKDKQSLLALVTDRLLEDVRLDPPQQDWRDELRTRALTLHAALLNTRDAAELVATVVALGTGGRRLRTVIAEAVPQHTTLHNTSSSTPDRTIETLVDTVCSLLLGNALITQQRAQAAELGVVSADLTPISELSLMLDLVLDVFE